MPEIAHETAPRAFAVGEEYRGAGEEPSCFVGLRLEKKRVRPPGIQEMSVASSAENPAVAFRRFIRICIGRHDEVNSSR